jgi:hypothetical protein
MKNVQKIIDLFGGMESLKEHALKIVAPGFMPLCIEYIGTGPRNLPLVSVAHYGELNGDPMRDPDMVFEVMPVAEGEPHAGRWLPVSYRNDYVALFQEAVFVNAAGQVMEKPRLQRELTAFARMWDRNIKDQGFLDAAQVAARQVPPAYVTQPKEGD